jgi:hypothetical protein
LRARPEPLESIGAVAEAHPFSPDQTLGKKMHQQQRQRRSTRTPTRTPKRTITATTTPEGLWALSGTAAALEAVRNQLDERKRPAFRIVKPRRRTGGDTDAGSDGDGNGKNGGGGGDDGEDTATVVCSVKWREAVETAAYAAKVGLTDRGKRGQRSNPTGGGDSKSTSDDGTDSATTDSAAWREIDHLLKQLQEGRSSPARSPMPRHRLRSDSRSGSDDGDSDDRAYVWRRVPRARAWTSTTVAELRLNAVGQLSCREIKAVVRAVSDSKTRARADLRGSIGNEKPSAVGAEVETDRRRERANAAVTVALYTGSADTRNRVAHFLQQRRNLLRPSATPSEKKALEQRAAAALVRDKDEEDAWRRAVLVPAVDMATRLLRDLLGSFRQLRSRREAPWWSVSDAVREVDASTAGEAAQRVLPQHIGDPQGCFAGRDATTATKKSAARKSASSSASAKPRGVCETARRQRRWRWRRRTRTQDGQGATGRKKVDVDGDG